MEADITVDLGARDVLVMLSLLPDSGDLDTLKTCQELSDEADKPKPIRVTQAAADIIAAKLDQLNKSKKLLPMHKKICQQFMEREDDG